MYDLKSTDIHSSQTDIVIVVYFSRFIHSCSCSLQTKQQPVKTIRQMPVATVTDNVATKAKRNEPQGGTAVRSIPTSSVTIKPKTGYSYNGATDSGTKKASVAKPQRAKQLIQAPPTKKSSGKAKKTTSEVYKQLHWLLVMNQIKLSTYCTRSTQ